MRRVGWGTSGLPSAGHSRRRAWSNFVKTTGSMLYLNVQQASISTERTSWLLWACWKPRTWKYSLCMKTWKILESFLWCRPLLSPMTYVKATGPYWDMCTSQQINYLTLGQYIQPLANSVEHWLVYPEVILKMDCSQIRYCERSYLFWPTSLEFTVSLVTHTHALTHAHTESTSRLVSPAPSGQLLTLLFLGCVKMYYNQTSSLPSPCILHSDCDQLQWT